MEESEVAATILTTGVEVIIFADFTTLVRLIQTRLFYKQTPFSLCMFVVQIVRIFHKILPFKEREIMADALFDSLTCKTLI